MGADRLAKEMEETRGCCLRRHRGLLLAYRCVCVGEWAALYVDVLGLKVEMRCDLVKRCKLWELSLNPHSNA